MGEIETMVIEGGRPSATEIGQRYLDLLKRTLTRSLGDDSFSSVPPNNRTALKRLRFTCYAALNRVLKPLNLAVAQTNRATGETMMGLGALNNLHACLDDIIADGIPGDVMEAGVWRGGGCIFIRAHLLVHGAINRKVWVADSFEGLPKPSGRFEADANDNLWQSEYLAVSEEAVRNNFRKYDLLDDQVVFLKGFFSDTMPTAPIERLALLRLDGDMYESTYVVLKHLYDRLSLGGYVIIDDYGMVDGCDKAIHDFRREHNIAEELKIIGSVSGKPLGAYWRKG